jgi:hypothetical protein
LARFGSFTGLVKDNVLVINLDDAVTFPKIKLNMGGSKSQRSGKKKKKKREDGGVKRGGKCQKKERGKKKGEEGGVKRGGKRKKKKRYCSRYCSLIRTLTVSFNGVD